MKRELVGRLRMDDVSGLLIFYDDKIRDDTGEPLFTYLAGWGLVSCGKIGDKIKITIEECVAK